MTSRYTIFIKLRFYFLFREHTIKVWNNKKTRGKFSL